LLGVIAEDVAIQEKADGRYLHGGWIGRYTWRGRRRQDMFTETYREFQAKGSSWPLLKAGLFGQSSERAEYAFAAMAEKVTAARQRQF
jgi:hypothetical protein